MTTFADTGLGPAILTALEELGFENPTPIQEKCIPHLLASDKDLIALAQTGTGKTAAFSLPIVHKLDPDTPRGVKALILCPTRELCLQIKRDVESFIKFSKWLSVVAIYGGESVSKQLRSLQTGAQIVVGTPGRVLDFANRKKLILDNIDFLVMDEADEMLNMGFKEDLDAILAQTPETKQTLLFSATMPDSIQKIAKKYMKNAEQIQVQGANRSTDSVSHRYYVVHARDRYEALRRIADMNPQIYGIVFCRTRRETQEVADALIRDNYSAEALHGDISQDQREQVMDRFRKRQTQLLVATDVAARGIDVNELTHVINYQLPDTVEAYIHRSGRTGRAHSTGLSIAIIHMKEHYRIRDIERKIGQKFEQSMIPGGLQICEKQLFTLVDRVKNVEVSEDQIQQFLPAIETKLKDLDRGQLIKHFISMEFNRFLKLYQNAEDLNVKGGQHERGAPRNGARQRGGSRADGITFDAFVINLGRKDGFEKKHFFGLVNAQPKLRGVEIGKIQVEGAQTVFQLDSQARNAVQDSFQGLVFNGRNIQVKNLPGYRSDRNDGSGYYRSRRKGRR